MSWNCNFFVHIVQDCGRSKFSVKKKKIKKKIVKLIKSPKNYFDWIQICLILIQLAVSVAVHSAILVVVAVPVAVLVIWVNYFRLDSEGIAHCFLLIPGRCEDHICGSGCNATPMFRKFDNDCNCSNQKMYKCFRYYGCWSKYSRGFGLNSPDTFFDSCCCLARDWASLRDMKLRRELTRGGSYIYFEIIICFIYFQFHWINSLRI